MMRVISLLKKNGCFGALADQHGDDDFKAPFFGHETGTATGPAAFSVLTRRAADALRPCAASSPSNLQ